MKDVKLKAGGGKKGTNSGKPRGQENGLQAAASIHEDGRRPVSTINTRHPWKESTETETGDTGPSQESNVTS